MHLIRRRRSGAMGAVKRFTQKRSTQGSTVEYCKDCIDNMPYCVLIPKLGGEWKTVQDGEVIKCAGCEEELPPGTEYGVVDGVILCEDCIDEIPYCDLVTRMGAEWNTATEGDIYDGYDG